MSVKVRTLKPFLWGTATLFTALSFPFQVYANSPLPALLPYVLIGSIVALTRYFPPSDDLYRTEYWRSRNIDLVVKLYVFLVLFDCAWQAAFGAISPGETISALVNFLLPAIWYRYFRRYGSDREIRAVLVAVFAAGLLVGIYFAYDSYQKLALHQIGAYATKAFQYSINRTNLGAEAVSDSRVAAGYRSYGLLETHSVSGGWVILGAFAALALMPPNRRILRRIVVLVFGSMLLVGLNFTSIIAFSVIVLLFEFGGVEILRGRFSPRIAGNVVWLVVLVAVLVGGVLWAVGETMAQFLIDNVTGQSNLALGTGGFDKSMLSITLANVHGYIQHVAEYPMTVVWGDGFAGYGLTKGGDIGWVESLARFGLPLFLLIVVGLIRLITAGVRRTTRRVAADQRAPKLDRRALIEFAVCVTIMAIVTDLHYTVWAAKSVLPIIFFSLALYSRCLSTAPRSRLPEPAF